MSAEDDRHCANLELATGWALHALEPADEAVFARHLPTCSECAAEVRATEDMAVLLAADVEQLDPPAHLRDAVLSAARSPQVPRQNQPVGMAPRQHEATSATPSSSVGDLAARRRRRLAPRRMVLAAAAAGVLRGGGGLGWAGANQLTPSSTTSVSALDEQQVISALTDPSVRKVALTEQGSATPMALLLAGPKDATVVPVNMPNPASSSQYVLWGLPNAARPVPLGGVAREADAHGARSVAPIGTADPASFTTFAVSIEPAGSTPTAPTTIVATGQAKA